MEAINTRCVIAGGGPAGIMLGYMLARAGIDVTVLEKWPDFFRDFRGDTIHPSTMDVLHELGLLEDFLKLPHNETKKMVMHVGTQEITMADFTRMRMRAPFIAFIPQWDFLNFISAKAKAYPHFHLLMETEATDIIEEKGKVVGIRAKNMQGEFDIRAEVVVGADGRHSVVREKAKLEVENLGAPIDVLWFKLTQKDDGSSRSFGYLNAGKILVMLDRDTYWQCGYIIAKGEFEHIKGRGIEQFRRDLAMLASPLAPFVDELQNWDQIKLLTVTVDHLKKWYREGLLCIGDSAHAMSPVGGIGINLAIQDATAAANVLVPAFRKGVPGVADFARLQKRRALATHLTQKLQVFLHQRMIWPVLHARGPLHPPLIVRLLNKTPFLQWIPAHVVGIGFRPEHIRVSLDK